MVVEPRKAVACILVRGGDVGDVLLARRNTTLRFMGGHHVFPGGAIDESDGRSVVHGATDAAHAATIEAAVREVFEETGLLIACGDLPDPDELRQSRVALLQGDVAFDDLLAQWRLTLHSEDFIPAGTWVTPEFSKVRFATEYLLHRVRDDQQEELIEGEIIGLEWMSPHEARQRWHRGEIHLSAPVAYALQLLANASLVEALPMLARGTERAPGDHNRFEIRRGLTIIPLKSATIPPATHTNCIIVGEQQLYVIDPGADDEIELQHLATQLDHLIELGSSIEAIVLTHSHPDHVGGVDFLRDRFNIPVWAHAAIDEQVRFDIDRHLNEGEVIVSPGDPDWRLRALHTPGHDPGHLCFLEESTGGLLAGDMLANPGSIIVSHEYRGDMTQFMDSLRRLIDIPCKFIVPAHGMPLADPQRHLQQQLDHRQWREDKIAAAYEAGAITFDKLLATSYDDASPAALPLARHSLDAHLAKLGIELDS